MNPTQLPMFYEIVKSMYESFLRALLEEAIENPQSSVDEFVLRLFDLLMGYKK